MENDRTNPVERRITKATMMIARGITKLTIIFGRIDAARAGGGKASGLGDSMGVANLFCLVYCLHSFRQVWFARLLSGGVALLGEN